MTIAQLYHLGVVVTIDIQHRAGCSRDRCQAALRDLIATIFPRGLHTVAGNGKKYHFDILCWNQC